MSFQKLVYTRDWESPTDFPTIQPNEAIVRYDIQDLYNQAAVALNNLIDALEGSGASSIAASVTGLEGTTVQDILDELKTVVDTKLASTTAASTYETQASADLLVKTVSFDENTGVFTFTTQGGTSFTIDTLLEKVAVNFTYDADTQSLILTLKDGTTQSVSLSSFITELEFEDTTDIDFTVASHKVSATIDPTYKTTLEGYKTAAQTAAGNASTSANNANTYKNDAKDYRDAALQAKTDAQGYASDASGYATAASGSAGDALSSKTAAGNSATAASGFASTASAKATLAESWAVGGTNTRTGEDTNNAKYWAETAAHNAAGADLMTKVDYDPTTDGVATPVLTAGGIPAYVASRGYLSENGVTFFKNVAVSTWSTLSADVTDGQNQVIVDHTEFPYKAELTISGVTADHMAEVVFADAEAKGGNYSGYAVTGAGTVTLYSKVTTSIIIPVMRFIASLVNAGGPGITGSTYVYTQSSASATWVIQHNLNMYPSVTVVDSGGTTVVGTVVYNSANQITITFASAFSGTAYLN